MFVAQGIQREMYMRHIAICGLPGFTVFSTLSHKQHNFRKTLLNIKCVFFLFSIQRFSKTFLILRRNERDMARIVYWSCVKYPLFLLYFNNT